MKKVLCILMIGSIVFIATACSSRRKDLTAMINDTATYKVFCRDYSQVKAKNEKGSKAIQSWRDGFVTGNGDNGCINAGSPYDDTLIYQNIHFVMPRETIREAPDISAELENARQTIINKEDYMTDNDWYSMYTFHPGGQLRLTQDKKSFRDYVRWCDYETGEMGVKYADKNGAWERRTFTSRSDNATITQILQSDTGAKINMILSFDDISKMYNFGDNAEADLLYKKVVDDSASYIAEIAHYPSFEGSELLNAGYATMTRVIAVGGTKEKIIQKDSKDSQNVGTEKNPAIKITDADAVYLITISDRDFNMGTYEDFSKMTEYALLDSLVQRTRAVADTYGGINFRYEDALAPSAKEQSDLFNAVSFELGDGNDDYFSNEDLILLQRKSDSLNSSMVERAYNAGRYAMIACSGGNLISRLYGMWTGEWGCRWNGAFTMDANVNLQASGMNAAHCISYGMSYINFVLNQIDDWKTNAKRNFGFDNAIQVPCNTDGNSAISVEYNSTYAFQYWLDGASWMLDPIYEFYQCYGNINIQTDDGEKELLKDILLPLLTLQANFWEQLLTPEYYTDSNGDIHYEQGKITLKESEYYCIVPCYSPENMPKNMQSAITANAAIDISAAKRGFDMLIAVEKAVAYDGYEKDTARWQGLKDKLPPYLFDDTGAIKEWAANQFEENNEHRHISHLYCAWPANETQNNKELTAACFQAIANRNSAGNESEETQTHGWLHKGLVSARLKDKETIETCLNKLLATKVYYDSFMTDHNTHRGSNCYCTDTSLGILGVINEMLLYSDTGVIEILPALPDDLTKGSVKGLMAKTQAEIAIEWDNGTASATIKSNIDQTIFVSCAGSDAKELTLKSGEIQTVVFQY